MSFELYDTTTATHYQAYRPPIHSLMLVEILEDSFFESAIDIGCGTGTSSRALLPFCNKICGYDPSEAMIGKAHPHPKITYTSDFPESTNFDFFLFFGSLNYIDGNQMKNYLKRLSSNASLLCCDFVIDQSPLFDCFSLSMPKSNYQPNKNLSAFYVVQGQNSMVGRNTYFFECTPKQAAHLILSNSNYLSLFQRHFDNGFPEQTIIEGLQKTFNSSYIQLEAQGFWTLYGT